MFLVSTGFVGVYQHLAFVKFLRVGVSAPDLVACPEHAHRPVSKDHWMRRYRRACASRQGRDTACCTRRLSIANLGFETAETP